MRSRYEAPARVSFAATTEEVSNARLTACDPLFTPRPLGPFADIAGDAGGELATVLALEGSAHDLVSALLAETSGRRPAIFVLEDLHWADGATLDVLRLLARKVDRAAAVVLATYRDDELERTHPLRAVLGELATRTAVNFPASQEAGYTFHLPELSGKTCISNGAVGAMGDHFVNGSLLDEKLDSAHPEALVYATKPGGGFRLAALEYVIFKAKWEEAHGVNAAPPKLFGQTFDFVPSPNRFGLDPFYALHVWLFDRNPSGLFFAWNPKVSCPS